MSLMWRPRIAIGFASIASAAAASMLTSSIVFAQDREPPRFDAVIGVLDKPGYLPFEERVSRESGGRYLRA